MTPLFPEDNEPIEIKQGQTGDCYLLAALDCLYNRDPQCRAKIRGMFSEKRNGDVVIRVKHSELVQFRDPVIFRKKYDFQIDHQGNQDIITIPKEILENIDNHPDGVETNSLAVKIIERITSYYFVKKLDHSQDTDASLMAHNNTVPGQRHTDLASEFLSQFFDVTFKQISIEQLINYKQVAMDRPVYIEMYYDLGPPRGQMYHSFRVQKILENQRTPGGYDFVLVNPWDNQKTETFSLQQISVQPPYIFTVSASIEQYDFDWAIINNSSAENARYLFATPDLLQLVKTAIEQKKITIFANTINNIVTTYCKVPFTQDQLNALSETDRNDIFRYFQITTDNLDKRVSFISAKITTKADLLAKSLTAAIQEKSEGYVKTNLARFYFLNSANDSITRSGNLRELISSKKIGINDIAASPQLQDNLFSTGLSLVINGDVLVEHGKNFLKACKQAVTPQIYMNLMQDNLDGGINPAVWCKNPVALFKGIHRLYSLNNRLGKELFTHAMGDLANRFKISAQDMQKKISQENNTELSQWFTQLTGDSSMLFEQSLKKAIEEKKGNATYVETNLATFYFSNLANLVTRSGSLQELIRSKKIGINDIAASSQLQHRLFCTGLTSAITDCILTEHGKIFLQDCKQTVTSEIYTSIMNNSLNEIENPVILFEGIHRLYALNNQLGEEFFAHAVKDLARFQDMQEKISQGNNPELKQWFTRLNNKYGPLKFSKRELGQKSKEQILEENGFTKELNNLKLKIDELQQKAIDTPSNYYILHGLTNLLYNQLVQLSSSFKTGKLDHAKFTEECIKQINLCEPILGQRSELKDTISTMIQVLNKLDKPEIQNEPRPQADPRFFTAAADNVVSQAKDKNSHYQGAP